MSSFLRKTWKQISLPVCATLMLGGAVSASGAEETAGKILSGYTLEEAGSFEAVSGMSFSRGVFAVPEGEAYRIIAGAGNEIEGTYFNAKSIGNGLLTLRADTGDVNSTGLFTMDGEMLIPCEAAIIEWISNKTGTQEGRFLKVVYGTGVTEDKNECFFYSTSEMFSLTVGEDDTMYTGYAMIYDTVNRSFVGDVQCTNSYMNAIKECGNAVAVEDVDGTVTLYDASGRELKKTDNCQSIGNGYMILYEDQNFSVIDDAGNARFTSEEYLGDMVSGSGYLRMSSENGYMVIDLDGRQVLSDGYDYISSEEEGYFLVETDEEKYEVISPKGEVIAQSTDYFNQIIPGYFYTKENDQYTLVGPDGVIISGMENAPYDLCAMKDQDVLVLADADFTLHLDGSYANTLTDGLISSYSEESGKSGVLELFTGTQLLDYEYDGIYVADGYLYARQDNTWNIYQIILQYR